MKPIDIFHSRIADFFQQYILAISYIYFRGNINKAAAAAYASYSLDLGGGISTEPISLTELLQHEPAVKQGISELFQTKAIAAWLDLLDDIFDHYIEGHVDGNKLIPTMGSVKPAIDFSKPIPLREQVIEGLKEDFSFKPYPAKIKAINLLLNPNSELSTDLLFIRKHVLIRNATQHHSSKIYPKLLSELGVNEISISTADGGSSFLKIGDHISLLPPELHKLKSSLFILSSHWKKYFA